MCFEDRMSWQPATAIKRLIWPQMILLAQTIVLNLKEILNSEFESWISKRRQPHLKTPFLRSRTYNFSGLSFILCNISRFMQISFKITLLIDSAFPSILFGAKYVDTEFWFFIFHSEYTQALITSAFLLCRTQRQLSCCLAKACIGFIINRDRMKEMQSDI